MRTLLAEFPVLEAATTAVPQLLQAGLLPVAVEIIDHAMLVTVEEAFAFGLPLDVEAVMIVELAGPAWHAEATVRAAVAVLEQSGARGVRAAADAAERMALWQCRKRAFGAVGRLSPNYVSMDVVVPLGELPGLVREIQDVRARFEVKIATAFHAGDGNLHPAVHYDERREGDRERAHAAADAIIHAALRRSGSVTGEHGIGLEKVHALPWQVDAVTASLLHGIKGVFDPHDRLNPGKALPARGAGAVFATLPAAPAAVRIDWASLTITAPADTPVADLQAAALARGLWLPLGLAGGAPGRGLGAGRTIGDAVDRLLDGPSLLARATARDLLLEAWAMTGDGREFHVGAAVFKNVAGYDLPRLLCGADGRLARLRAVTLQLRPAPVGCWARRLEFADAGGTAGEAGTAWLSALARVADPLAGLQAVIERGTEGRWLSAVVIGGGSAPTAPDLPGAVTRAAHREAFAAAAELLEELGAATWSRDSGDWAAWQPLAGQGAAFLPPGPRRVFWQHAPRVVWTPDTELAADPAWLADVTCRGGASEALPPPGAGVPRQVLRGLKRCFDPDCALGGPAWLTGAGDA